MGSKASGRLDALTGLRFLAAACIVVHHSRGCFGFPAEYGFRFAFDQAVTFFFLLSGFILAYNYPDLSRPGDWGRFWLARWSRVWPAQMPAPSTSWTPIPASSCALDESSRLSAWEKSSSAPA